MCGRACNDAWKGVHPMNVQRGGARGVVSRHKTTREALSWFRRAKVKKKTVTYLLCCEGVEGAFEGALGGFV